MDELPMVKEAWSDSDEETKNKTSEEIFETFISAKNFFEPKLKIIETPEEGELIKDNNSNKERDDENNDETIVENNNEFLNKKTERNENNKDFEVAAKQITIEYDKNEERRMYHKMNINPTEARLYAEYVKQGKRIPRRGEVGITSQEIEYFESIGYVMSGSRHKKMNAVRQKIEGKIYSVEDKRALAIYNLEENIKKEKNIISYFKGIMNKNK